MSCLIGILFANGESWKEMRRFALSTLRDFGMGKRLAVDKILEECHHLIQMFEEHEGMELIYVSDNARQGVLKHKNNRSQDVKCSNSHFFNCFFVAMCRSCLL